MRITLLLILLLATCFTSAQQIETFQIEGKVVDEGGLPVEDAYIFNFRKTDKYVSRANGVFKIWVQASDSLAISHISYLRKVVSVFNIMMSPIVTLVKDSIYLKDINVSPSQRTDREIAMKNIKSIDFDFRTNPSDPYTEGERMQEMLQTHNRVERSAASSVSLVKLSPSEIIGKMSKKRQKRKEARKAQ